MQYQTPGRTVAAEEPFGQSRGGALGWDDLHPSAAAQSPLAPIVHGGGVGGVSERRSRPDKPMAKPLTRSTIANNEYVLMPREHLITPRRGSCGRAVNSPSRFRRLMYSREPVVRDEPKHCPAVMP